MSRIKGTFDRLAKERMGAYIPYICAGDPDADFTESLATTLLDSGADILELGIPFSDPVADGPVIQGAMGRSLSGGFRVAQIFDVVEAVRKKGYQQPIVLMTYSNPVLRMGVQAFCSRAAGSGADGILMVDMPIEESEELDRASKEHGLDVIRLVAPSTTDARMREIASRGSGFLYAVSAAGVTGARASLSTSAISLLRRAVPMSPLPVALGFGISSPGHVREALAAGARGVVEGSALVSAYAPSLGDKAQALESVGRHAVEMKAATASVRSRD